MIYRKPKIAKVVMWYPDAENAHSRGSNDLKKRFHSVALGRSLSLHDTRCTKACRVFPYSAFQCFFNESDDKVVFSNELGTGRHIYVGWFG